MVVCLAPNIELRPKGRCNFFIATPQANGSPTASRGRSSSACGGLAWGRGINPPQPGPQKVDGRSQESGGPFQDRLRPRLCAQRCPTARRAGHIIRSPTATRGSTTPKLADLGYNHLYTLPPDAPYPAWWQKEHMHLGDFAYDWLVLIEHNYDDPDPHGGQRDFFHVRRGEHYRTAGCTTMALTASSSSCKWLEPGSNAMLAELTRADYARLWKDWHLPPPASRDSRF